MDFDFEDGIEVVRGLTRSIWSLLGSSSDSSQTRHTDSTPGLTSDTTSSSVSSSGLTSSLKCSSVSSDNSQTRHTDFPSSLTSDIASSSVSSNGFPNILKCSSTSSDNRLSQAFSTNSGRLTEAYLAGALSEQPGDLAHYSEEAFSSHPDQRSRTGNQLSMLEIKYSNSSGSNATQLSELPQAVPLSTTLTAIRNSSQFLWQSEPGGRMNHPHTRPPNDRGSNSAKMGDFRIDWGKSYTPTLNLSKEELKTQNSMDLDVVTRHNLEFEKDIQFLAEGPNKTSTPEDRLSDLRQIPFLSPQSTGVPAENAKPGPLSCVPCHRDQEHMRSRLLSNSTSFMPSFRIPQRRLFFRSEDEEAVFYLITKYLDKM